MHPGDDSGVVYLFVAVDDIDVSGDDADAARFGRFVLCKDDQGNPFGLHQKPA